MLLSALHRIIRKISATSEPQWLLALALVSLAPRLLSALLVPTVPTSDYAWYDNRAAELAAGLGYQENGVPTSLWPPGYPLVLSLVYRLFGHSWLAGMLLNALLGTFICLLTYLVAKKVVGVTQARIAGLLIAFFPSQILYTSVLGTEVLFTALLLLIIYSLLRQPWDHHEYLYVALTGVVVGLATLVKPMLVLFPVVMFIWWLLAGISLKLAIVRLAVVFLSCFAVILPWSMRNLVQIGSPVLSTSGGVNLWIGNNPVATGGYYFPPDNPLEMGQFNGELEYDREGYRLALKFVREHPLKAVALVPKKIYYLFSTDTTAVYWATRELQRPLPLVLQLVLARISEQYYFAVLGLAVVSVALLRGWAQHSGILIILVLGYWVAVYAVFFGGDRFHFPIVPLFSILATEALAAFWAGANSLSYKSDTVAAAGS